MAASCTNIGLTLENGTFTTDNDTQFDHKLLDRYFNHGMTLTLPGMSQIPSAIGEILEEQMAYTLMGLPLYRLIEMPFVKAFVKKGQMFALSQNTRLDCHDCVAVTPSGWLVLYLTKDTYTSLGLESTKQTHMNKKNDVYVVKINLLEESFRPGKKGYDKVWWCLKDRLDLIFDFHIAWAPHDPEVCGSSIGVYFSDICRAVQGQDLGKAFTLLTSVPHPKIKWDEPDGSEDTEGSSCNYQDVFEWMGAIACGVDGLSNESGSYQTSLNCPTPSTNCPRCLVYQIKGFITSHTVARIYKQLRMLSPTLHKDTSFPISLTVHGVKDTPVFRKVITPEFSIPGDSLYSVLLFPDDNFWFLTAGEL